MAEGTEVTMVTQETTSSVTPVKAGASVVLIAAVHVIGGVVMLAVVLLVALLCKHKRHDISQAK